MKALINENNVVIQTVANDETFEVSSPWFWVACPDNIVAYEYQYLDNTFVAYDGFPSAEENKQTAIDILNSTDWTSIPDVADPTKSNPYLANQAEFIAYRNAIRPIAINPQAGKIQWAVAPTEDWQTV